MPTPFPTTCTTCGGDGWKDGLMCETCYGGGSVPITTADHRILKKLYEDMTDTLNDILDKCNDIFQKVNE